MIATQTKESIRTSMKQKRAQLSSEAVTAAAISVIRHFRRLRYGISWLLYSPVQNELSTWPLFEFARNLRQDKVFFPRAKGSDLFFHQVDSVQELKQGAFCLEPSSHSPEWNPQSPSVIVVPGLAFTRTGHRLGFGKGFYDQFLAKHPRFPRLAVAYDFQIVSEGVWTPEKHDRVVDFIATPAGVWGSPRVLNEN